MTSRIDGTILVLGAGATRGGGFHTRLGNTNFQVPLDQDFFETPAVQTIFNQEKFPALTHYQRDPGLETTWATVDLHHKLCRSGIISEEVTHQHLAEALRQRASESQAYRMKMEQEERSWRIPSMAGWELHTLVRKVFKSLVHPQPQQSPLYSLVERLRKQGLIGIVTFNYDTSIEQLYKDRFYDKFYYPLFECQNSEGKRPLFKLHGSLNWQTDSTPASLRRITVMNPPTMIATMDHGVGWYRQPEVVGPTFFKQEINLDIQQDFRTDHYRKLWGLAWNLLRSARRLVFVGFSFPQTDFHAAALFRTAHLSGVGFRQVILCHRYDANLRGTADQVFAGRPTEFTEFKDGLEDMAEKLDELTALLET